MSKIENYYYIQNKLNGGETEEKEPVEIPELIDPVKAKNPILRVLLATA